MANIRGVFCRAIVDFYRSFDACQQSMQHRPIGVLDCLLLDVEQQLAKCVVCRMFCRFDRTYVHSYRVPMQRISYKNCQDVRVNEYIGPGSRAPERLSILIALGKFSG
jgi:hypothetical protein